MCDAAVPDSPSSRAYRSGRVASELSGGGSEIERLSAQFRTAIELDIGFRMRARSFAVLRHRTARSLYPNLSKLISLSLAT